MARGLAVAFIDLRPEEEDGVFCRVVSKWRLVLDGKWIREAIQFKYIYGREISNRLSFQYRKSLRVFLVSSNGSCACLSFAARRRAEWRGRERSIVTIHT